MEKRIVAFDIGDKRVGIAASDPFNTFALPGETYWRTRNAEEDAAKLAVFTAAYDPPWTPAKTRLAAFLLGKCQRRLGLDWGLLEEEMARELAAMGRRRGKEMDPALLGPVLELAKENYR